MINVTVCFGRRPGQQRSNIEIVSAWLGPLFSDFEESEPSILSKCHGRGVMHDTLMLKRETTPDLADTVVPVFRFVGMGGAAYCNRLSRARAFMTTSRYVCATRRSRYRIAYVLVRRSDPRILLVMRQEQTAGLQGCAGWHVPVRPSNCSEGGQVGPDILEGKNPVSQAQAYPCRRRASSTTALAIVVLATSVRVTVELATVVLAIGVLVTVVRVSVLLAIFLLATAVRNIAVRITVMLATAVHVTAVRVNVVLAIAVLSTSARATNGLAPST